jgi:hypothetical protein
MFDSICTSKRGTQQTAEWWEAIAPKQGKYEVAFVVCLGGYCELLVNVYCSKK